MQSTRCAAIFFVCLTGTAAWSFEERLKHNALFPPGMQHVHYCAVAAVGGEWQGEPWQGSCDINLTDARPLTRADWNVSCDPWNADLDRSHVTAYDPETYLFSSTADEQGHDLDFSWTVASGWTCPPEQRSASGCGDFRSDTRGAVCEKKVSAMEDGPNTACIQPGASHYRRIRISEWPAMLVPQRHVCSTHPIFYDNLDDFGWTSPPPLGRHRERWAKCAPLHKPRTPPPIPHPPPTPPHPPGPAVHAVQVGRVRLFAATAVGPQS